MKKILFIACIAIALACAGSFTGCSSSNEKSKNDADYTAVETDKHCSPNVFLIKGISPIGHRTDILRYEYYQENGNGTCNYRGCFIGTNGDFKIGDSVMVKLQEISTDTVDK